LLFTDVVMPGPMRSTELARKAKAMLPGLAVLYTSGYTENSIVHGGRLDAGVELLSKPYTREALARKIRHVLSNARQHLIAVERIERQEQTPVHGEPDQEAGATRVLVVEDEPLILMATVDMISELGHTVHEAGSAEDALAVLEEEQIDILLTDVGLPGMAGTDLAKRVRERWPTVRIVFASGDDSARAASGIDDAFQLAKPFTIDGLALVLSKCLALP